MGMTAAGSPGAFQTYLINTSLQGGWRKGALVAMAPLISDPLIILAILLLLDNAPAGVLRAISLAGGIYALYLAWGLWRQWQSGQATAQGELPAQQHALRRGVLMNFLSPGPYTFWMLVNGPLLLSALQQSIWAGIAFLLGFYGFFVGGMLAIAVLFDQARRLGPRAVRVMILGSILILVIFAVVLIKRGIAP